MDLPDDLAELFNKIEKEKSATGVEEVPSGWFSAEDMKKDIRKSMTSIRNALRFGVDSGMLECRKFSIISNGKKSTRTFYYEKNKSDREETKKRKSRRDADRK